MTHLKVCKQCGKSFEADKKSRQFCSYVCSGKSKEIQKPETICAQCGKPFMVSRFYRFGVAKFCSHACYLENAKVYKTCPQCGKRFYGANDVYCSSKCVNDSQRKRTEKPCAHCGKTFEVKPHQQTNGKGLYCSRRCMHDAQIAQRIEHICEYCGKRFTVILSQERARNVRFCSLVCTRKYSGESNPEKIIRSALEKIGVYFQQEHQILNYYIDFFIPSLNIALEVDGDYWHGLKIFHDRKRDKDLLGVGVPTVRIKESEIIKSNDVILLVRNRLGL